jgi:hypothetical protein
METILRKFVESEDPDYEKILAILLQDNIYNVEDALFQWTCIDYAVRSRLLISNRKYLLKNILSDVNLNVLFEYYTNESVAYYSVVLNFCNLFTAIVRKRFFRC